MARKVRIEITGVHMWAGADEAGERIEEREETVTEAEGTWSVQNGKDFLLYTEDTEDGPVRTLLKLSPGRLEVTKSGALRSRLELEIGKVSETWYETPAGRLGLEIRTSALEAVRDEDCLRRIRAEYELLWGGELGVSCRLEVRIADGEKAESGY